MEIKYETKSLCPDCLKEGITDFVPAKVIQEEDSTFIVKTCEKHGKTKEVVWNNAKLFDRAMNYIYTGKGVSNPQVLTKNCPNDCGLCPLHTSTTVLANLDVTNRCNLKCWYCFANSASAGYVYEPSMEQIKNMLQLLRDQKPVPCPAIQFSGGEPLVRKEIVEIIKMAKDMGFAQVQIASNAIELAKDPRLAVRIREAGLNIIYMKWNGMTEKTNTENLKYKDDILKACRKANLGIVLVPAVIRGFNDDQVGPIVKFATENIDVIRGVNFQPLAFVGRIENIDVTMKDKQRYTIPDLVRDIEKQTGFLKEKDWYPVPFVVPFSQFISNFKNKQQVEFSAHPICGMASYLYVKDGKSIPITDFIDVEGFVNFLHEKSNILKDAGKIEKLKAGFDFAKEVGQFVNKEKTPKDLNIVNILTDVLKKGTHKAIADFHLKTLYIGTMHFQDAWNMDFERVSRCVIHYVTPEMKLIPFCAYNCLSQYRAEYEKKYSITFDEWKEKNPAKDINGIA